MLFQRAEVCPFELLHVIPLCKSVSWCLCPFACLQTLMLSQLLRALCCTKHAAINISAHVCIHVMFICKRLSGVYTWEGHGWVSGYSNVQFHKKMSNCVPTASLYVVASIIVPHVFTPQPVRGLIINLYPCLWHAVSCCGWSIPPCHVTCMDQQNMTRNEEYLI